MPTIHPPTDLPDGWALASLGDVVQPSKEKADPQSVPDLPYLSLEHIEANSRRIVGQAVAREATSTKAIFRAGDVLYGKLRPYLNKVCRPGFDGVCSTDILVFSQRPELDSRYLLYFLNRPEVVEATTHAMAGVNLPRVSFKTLGRLDFPLPPLAEQRRIADRIDTLLGKVDGARERLAKLVEDRKEGDREIPSILTRFRQAVLAAACSGRLTEDWREANPDVVDGEALLARIHEERESVGTRKRRKVAAEEDEARVVDAQATTWETPESWTWCRIRDVLHYERSAAYGVLQPGSDIPSGILFVRVCDLVRGTVDTSEIKRIDAKIDAQYPRTRLEGAEVLVTLVGTIGRTAVVPPELAGANIARAVGMLPLCPHVEPSYLRMALDQPEKNTELVDLAREVARKTLNLGLLKAVSFPLPPHAEQVEIVRRVEQISRLSESIVCRVEGALGRSDRLTQAVFAKAFRGELVATEAEIALANGTSFETGEQLLDRVKAQAPAQAKKPRGRRQTTRASRRSGSIDMRKLSEVAATHLQDILKDSKSGMAPEKLLDAAALEVDDFYTQLKREVEAGQVRERRKGKSTILLEAVS